MLGIKENIPELRLAHDMSQLFKHRVADTFIEKFGHTINNIKIIKNAILPQDIQESLDVIYSAPILENRDHCYSTYNIPGFVHSEKDGLLTHRLKEKLIGLAEKSYGEKLLRDKPMQYMIHPTGSYIGAHTDILDIDYKNNDPERDAGPTQQEQLEMFPNMWSGHLAILAYLNDDYEGGYLYFPEFDYYLKPSPGDVVMFPGSLYYVHGVSKVTSGTRYTLSQWAKFDFYKK
jgi:hypothetical protein